MQQNRTENDSLWDTCSFSGSIANTGVLTVLNLTLTRNNSFIIVPLKVKTSRHYKTTLNVR